MNKSLNMANRQCCNVHILDYATMKPWMFVDFCNTTTAGFESDAVYANKKGAKYIISTHTSRVGCDLCSW